VKLSYILAGAACLAALGLWYLSRGGDAGPEAQTCVAESWIHLPDRELLDGVQAVPQSDYLALQGQLQRLALQRLDKAPFHRLTDEEAKAAKIAEREAGWPYFMRAVTFNPDKNRILIGKGGADYFVTHFDLGAVGTAMKCWPVLIFLKEPPARVFVKGESAE
jgi:hypothetical protein